MKNFTEKELELITLLVRTEYENFVHEENEFTPGLIDLESEQKYVDFLKNLLDKLEGI